MKLIFTLLYSFLITHTLSAQKIFGTVFNDQGDLLPFASVTVKGTSKGTSANNKAAFSISLPAGTYTLICQHIGYSASEKTVTVGADQELSFILGQQKLVMKEVVVKTGGEDPAYEIIRQAIKKRNVYNTEVKAFTCDIYGKDVLKLRRLPNRMFGKKIKDEDKEEMGIDSTGKGIIYLSESVSKAYKQNPDKFKLEVISSRVSGSESFGFTFPSFISLYENNVTVFSNRLNPRGFVSPISDRAIGFYKFKFLGTFFEDGKAINSIRVTPRRNYEPLFSGILNITDGDWRIHSFNLSLTKTSQLEILDTLQITQLHVPVGEVWRTKNQLLHFNFKMFGIDAIGNFLSVYSDYNVAPVFAPNFFDKIIIKYDTAVNKRSIGYWDSTRAVPLEAEEIKDYKNKDSIFQRNKDSVLTSQHIDSLKKRQGNLKLLQLFTTGIHRTHYSKTNQFSWGIAPLLFNTEFNTAEGIATSLNPYIRKSLKKGKGEIALEPLLRYGFGNTHFNPSATLRYTTSNSGIDKKPKNETWVLLGGKRVSEFNKESVMSPLTNTIRTLLLGNNFMKTYENTFLGIQFSKAYESGLRFTTNIEYEDRKPLNNTTNYTFRKKDSINITPNYPFLKIPAQFSPHQALIVGLEVSFKPGQRFIQLPYTKIPIGSKYPTFTVNYAKAIRGVGGSDADFDKWQFTIRDDKNLKLAGKINYRLGIGGFLNKKNVPIQDFKHFNRNSGAFNSFQLTDFYLYSIKASFYSFAHVEHHFNGLLTNKIPLFRKLNWNLVAGSDAFFVNEKTNYIEVFGGLENIFKVLRVDAIAGYAPGKPMVTGIRFSTGGLMGDRIKARVNRQSNSVNIEF